MLNVLVCCIERGPGPGPREMESLRVFKKFLGTKREEISWVFCVPGRLLGAGPGSWGWGPGGGRGGWGCAMDIEWYLMVFNGI